MLSLFSNHPLLLQTSFSELKRQATDQDSVFVGSAGSIGVREVRGGRFLYRQFYDAQGRKAAQYLGPEATRKTQARAEALQHEIGDSNALAKDARLLVRQGYVRADSKVTAILAALSNGGLFRAGAVLVGSHAFGCLLNELGIRAAAFATEDVDVARGSPLEVPEGKDFARLLADSTVPLSPVLGFDRKAKPTSYKALGRDPLRVDLLVPTDGSDVGTRAVPELNAHATALPYLRYVLGRPMESVVIGRDSIVPVRVPRPESFAWHKMLVSQLRSSRVDKRAKDLLQASVLVAALAESAPDALEGAFADLPKSAQRKARAGARVVLAKLESTCHSRAIDLLKEIA